MLFSSPLVVERPENAAKQSPLKILSRKRYSIIICGFFVIFDLFKNSLRVVVERNKRKHLKIIFLYTWILYCCCCENLSNLLLLNAVSVSPHLGWLAMLVQLELGWADTGDGVSSVHLLFHSRGPQRSRVSKWEVWSYFNSQISKTILNSF